MCPGEWATLAAFHLLRGAESAAANHRDLTFSSDGTVETLVLPVSKTDQAAAGVRRSWGCVCLNEQDPSRLSAPCAYHAAVTLADVLCDKFANNEGFVPGGVPLFPNSDGGRCTRQAFVATIEAMAILLGLPIVSSDGTRLYGEHTWRVGGSRHMHRMGIDVPTIMRLARWGSDVVLRYLSDAVLTTLTSRYRANVFKNRRANNCVEPITEADVERLIARRCRDAQPDQATTSDALQALLDATASLEALQSDIHARADASETLTSEVRLLRNMVSPPYAENLKSSKFHVLRPSAGLDTGSQKTSCGLNLANLARRAHLPSDSSTFVKCFNCFGAGIASVVIDT